MCIRDRDKYMTISVNKKNIEDARNYFARVGADLIAHFEMCIRDRDSGVSRVSEL